MPFGTVNLPQQSGALYVRPFSVVFIRDFLLIEHRIFETPHEHNIPTPSTSPSAQAARPYLRLRKSLSTRDHALQTNPWLCARETRLKVCAFMPEMAPEASLPKRKPRENQYLFDLGVRGRHVVSYIIADLGLMTEQENWSYTSRYRNSR